MIDGAIESRGALRLPAMRRTVWILQAETAHLAYHASDAAQPFAWLLKRSGISEDEYARVEHQILLAAGKPLPIDGIRELINDPPEKLSTVLQVMCGEGKLLRVKAATQISNAFSYVATRVWLGRDLPEADPAEALAWLAGGYLKAFGPARVEDFAWWAGAPKREADKAIRSHDAVDVGDRLVMLPSDVHAFELTRPVAGRVNLLPAWDAYTMGYAEPSRSRFASAEVLPYLYDKGGNATSVILVEGEVAGLWDFTLEDRDIEIRVGLFEDPSPRAWGAIQAEASLVAGFFNAREVKIKRVKIRAPISRSGVSHLKPLAATEKPKPPRKGDRKATKAAKAEAEPALVAEPGLDADPSLDDDVSDKGPGGNGHADGAQRAGRNDGAPPVADDAQD